MTTNDDLMKFISSVSGDSFVKVEENLGDGYVRLNISEAERRQAKHDIRSVEDIIVELLRNARDAHAQKIFVATVREGDKRTLVVVDDGVGVPAAMAERIFEPRVTSKLETMVVDTWGVHGRGMALFSIRSNTLQSRIAASAPHKGTAVLVETDAKVLAEKTDQSTWPTVEKDESGALRVTKGPHNIIRRVSEFALEHPGIDLYLGSLSEVLATLVMLARFEVDEADLLFCEDRERLPIWARPGSASTALELARIAEALALPVSERTAHRIMGGEVTPLSSVRSRFNKGGRRDSDVSVEDIYRDQRGLKVHHTDLAAFRNELEQAFDSLAEKYYLHLKSEPRVTVGRDEIRVRFEIEKSD